jgi:hypothetical protein
MEKRAASQEPTFRCCKCNKNKLKQPKAVYFNKQEKKKCTIKNKQNLVCFDCAPIIQNHARETTKILNEFREDQDKLPL